jgi:hypothetical protein
MKGTIEFDTRFKSFDFQELDLPVELRRPSYALVSRSIRSKPVSVEPGAYHVSATLPTGVEIFATVHVEPGKSVTAVLTPDAAAESPHESHEWQHFVVAPFAPGGRPEAASSVAYLRSWKGNALNGRCKTTTPTRLRPRYSNTIDLAEFGVTPSAATQYVQLTSADGQRVTVAVPGSTNRGAVVSTRRSTEGVRIAVRLHSSAAALLLGYLAHDRSRMAGDMTDAMDAEGLLRNKTDDPVAAAVGAYSLLQMNAIERLHDWDANLMNWFTWLPDGAAIRGEHLARLGRHQEALDAFLKLRERGLPMFSRGLSYAIERLRLYQSAQKQPFDRKTRAAIDAFLGNLTTVAAYVDYGEPVTTIVGVDPDQVFAARPKNRPASADALSLAGYLFPKEARKPSRLTVSASLLKKKAREVLAATAAAASAIAIATRKDAPLKATARGAGKKTIAASRAKSTAGKGKATRAASKRYAVSAAAAKAAAKKSAAKAVAKKGTTKKGVARKAIAKTGGPKKSVAKKAVTRK